MIDPGTASLASSLISGVGGFLGQNSANKAAKRMQAEQQRFQWEVLSNAHQIEVRDLKNAGLNPVLSAGGGGAKAMPGASPVPVGSELGAGISSALQAASIDAQIKNMEEDTDLKRDQQVTQRALTKQALAQASSATAQSRQLNAATGLLNSQQPKADAEASVDKSWMGRKAIQVNRFVRNLFGGAPAAVNSAKGVIN